MRNELLKAQLLESFSENNKMLCIEVPQINSLEGKLL
jgi:hypothetical protein